MDSSYAYRISLLRRLARLPRFLASSSRIAWRHPRSFLALWRAVAPRVRGWLRLPDAHFLYDAARTGRGEGVIVEIGSAFGRSTIFLARGSMDAGRERVIAIDPHTGFELNSPDSSSPRAEFEANLTAHGVRHHVDLIPTTSHAAAQDEVAQPIRLLFIDGLHDYEAVALDIADWVPRVVPDGIILFDDYVNPDPRFGVRRAVDELVASGLVEPKLHTAFNLTWTHRLDTVRIPPADKGRTRTSSVDHGAVR